MRDDLSSRDLIAYTQEAVAAAQQHLPRLTAEFYELRAAIAQSVIAIQTSREILETSQGPAPLLGALITTASRSTGTGTTRG